MSLVICAPASSVISQQFNDHNHFRSVFYLTAPNLGQVFSSLYIGPLSEHLGRAPVCHFFNFMFLIFTVITGFSNSIAMIIIFRVLAGTSIASICLNPAITGDLFPVQKRGSAMSLTNMVPILGSAIGPIAGGYITQYLSWRWTFWLMAISSACTSLLMVVILRESYLPVIKKQSTRGCASNRDKPQSPCKYFLGWNLATMKATTLLVIRPFVILSSSRVAVLMAFYLALQ